MDLKSGQILGGYSPKLCTLLHQCIFQAKHWTIVNDPIHMMNHVFSYFFLLELRLAIIFYLFCHVLFLLTLWIFSWTPSSWIPVGPFKRGSTLYSLFFFYSHLKKRQAILSILSFSSVLFFICLIYLPNQKPTWRLLAASIFLAPIPPLHKSTCLTVILPWDTCIAIHIGQATSAAAFQQSWPLCTNLKGYIFPSKHVAVFRASLY